MVEPDRITSRLDALGAYLSALERFRSEDREAYFSDQDVRWKVERALQLALQCCIDVGGHLVAELGHGAPTEYAGVFLALGDAGVLELDLAARLADAARQRNLLVHAYLDVDPAQVWTALEHLDDLRAFAAAALRAAG